MALVAVVAPVSAQTPSSLQHSLLAQMAAIADTISTVARSGTTTGTGTGACAGITFTRNLTVGSTGSDVKCLQAILNQSASTKFQQQEQAHLVWKQQLLVQRP